MQASLVTKLILKDIMLNRAIIIGSLLAIAFSLFVATLSRTGYAIGGITFITTMVAMGIFVAMYGVLKERENQSWLFVLSLPVSTMQYYVAKLVASLISFLLPWGLALVATIMAYNWIDALPNGFIPFFVLLMLFFLHNFSVFLAVALLTSSEVWIAATIIITNVSITLFMFFLNSLPSIEANIDGPVAVWSPEILFVMFYELAVVVLVLAFAMFMQSRRRDFV